MIPTRAFRKPLTLGNSSMYFVAAGLACAHIFVLVEREFGYLGALAAILLGIGGWSARASDILFDRSGLRVLGRKLERRAFTWDEVQSADVYELVVPRKDSSKPDRKYLLRVMTPEGIALVADGRGEDERAELEVIAGSIAEVVEPRTETSTSPAPRDAAASVLRCQACGALVAPADRDEVGCTFCGSAVPMPEQVRVRVRNAAELAKTRAREQRAVERLMTQPRAGRVVALQALTFAAGLGSALAWTLPQVPPLVAVILSLATIVAFGVERMTMVDRRAVRVLTRCLGAIPPLRPGAPSLCRCCGAPLSDAPGASFAHCVFCGQANLLHADLRGAARRSAEATFQLESVLKSRGMDRSSVIRWTVAALVIATPICFIGFLARR